MKTAKEMRAIASEVNENMKRVRKEMATEHIESTIAPQIEKRAEVGLYEVYVTIPKHIDIDTVATILVANGYIVQSNVRELKIKWKY